MNRNSQKKRNYQDDYLQHGFTYLVQNGLQIPQCVVCHKTFSNSTMKPAPLKQHLSNAHPELAEKNRSFFELKLSSLKRAKLDDTGTFRKTNKNIVQASYAIGLQVAKTKKAHTIGESLIKPCILESVRLVLGEEAFQKMKQISLSNDTIKSRIDEMSENIKDKVVLHIISSPFFALQLDESTDVANLSQLLVFSRHIRDGKIEEQFLFCRPLETTSKAIDVFEMVDNFFKETGMSWTNLIAVCTDGAPAMLGTKSGFVALVKRKNPDVQGTHCMIHREALASKTMPNRLREHLTDIINVVNYVKNSAVNTRLFRQLCKDMDADHTDLLFHTKVRWLSKGNMLSRFFELRKEIKLFLLAQEKADLLEACNKEGFEARLAYLADIFESLNELNKKMQGTGSNIIMHNDIINAFMAKLQLFANRARNGNFISFQRLNDIIGDAKGLMLKQDVIDHLETLQNEFKRYFPGVDTANISMQLTRNPFLCQVDDVSEDLQEEFLELIYDSSAKDVFRDRNLEDFWICMHGCYPRLSSNAFKILIPFSSTYLCESGFSSLLAIKSKARNRLNVESDLRCSLSNILPDIEELVRKKQAQPSH